MNGYYKVLDELSGGMPVYKKAAAGGEPERYLEYHVGTKKWHVKSAEHRGTTTAWACSKEISPPVRPEMCEEGTWKVFEGSGSSHVLQPSVLVRIADPAVVSSFDEENQRYEESIRSLVDTAEVRYFR